LDSVLRLVTAALLAGAIGIGPELRDKPAGLRTHMLTGVAAALFTIVTFEIRETAMRDGAVFGADPIRIIEAVTAGVAFLASGMIIASRRDVTGLTTGAGMWLAGAVGVACGAGLYSLAAVSTALAILIAVLMRYFETYILATKPAPVDQSSPQPPVNADPGGGEVSETAHSARLPERRPESP
jgi:putative Mg2+ transporter-C (MgtC) family protein